MEETDTAPPVEPPPLRPELRSRRRSIALWSVAAACLVACAALIVLAVSAAIRTTPDAGPTGTTDTTPAALGKNAAAPSFDLPRLGGGAPVTLAAVRGRPVIINFFASWCTDCQKELAAFAVASRHLAGKVEFIGIDTNDDATATALALLRHAGDHYPSGVDGNGQTADRYLVGALPETFFVDARGRIISFSPGAETVAGLLAGATTLMRR